MRFALIFMLCAFSETLLFAQSTVLSDNQIIQELTEKWLENSELEADYTDLQDQLEYLIKNKININNTKREELVKLFFLSETEVDALIKHREKYGKFISQYELQAVEDLSEMSRTYLIYFTKFDEKTEKPFSLKSMLHEGKSEIIMTAEGDLETREGYKTKERQELNKTYYLGSPYRFVSRYRFNSGKNLSSGINAEKDKGEQFFRGAQKSGFDFYSAHLFLRNIGNFKYIALGDFHASFGQGLTMSSGLAASKSAYVMNLQRNNPQLRPYRSVNENGFLRGAALTYQFNKFRLTTLFSRRFINTNYSVADSLSQGDELFSSIVLSGLHRTQSEIEKKANVLQTVIGANLSFDYMGHNVGLTFVNTAFDKIFNNISKPYQLYNFNGNSNSNLGFNYSGHLKNILYFGESATNASGALATINGAIIPVHKNVDVGFLYRNYSMNYQSTFANCFGEYSNVQNEEGFYSAISIKLKRNITLSSYFDFFRSPWLRYLVDAPSNGIDILSDLQINLSKTWVMDVRIRLEEKQRNKIGNDDVLDPLETYRKKAFRCDLQYILSKSFVCKSRIEITGFSGNGIEDKMGFLYYTDFNYKLQPKYSFAARFALFDINDYNARIYAYESEVLYQYNIQMFYNSGYRYYLLLNYQPRKDFEFWIRYSQISYSNINVISSGLEQIIGNRLREVTVQVLIKI